MNYVLSALIREDNGFYVAECPEIGTCSQGKTIEEATSNLRETTELYLEEFPLQKMGGIFLTTFEVAACASQ